MKILISATAELQNFLKVDSTFVISTLFPYQETAIEMYLRSVVGEDLCTNLVNHYADPPEEDIPELDNLLPYAQRVVAKFAFFKAAPNFDLKLSDAGFAVVSNQNLAPASKDRVNRFVESLEADGWDAVEMLLRFLENNEEDYPEWVESPEYSKQTRNFINSAEEFDEFVSINKSRLKFLNLRNRMDDIEILCIEPVISKELATEIKTQVREDTLSDANAILLPYIKRALANLVAAEVINPSYKNTGNHYLAKCRLILDADPESYPEYYATTYVAEKTYQPYENTEDTAFFVAGS